MTSTSVSDIETTAQMLQAEFDEAMHLLAGGAGPENVLPGFEMCLRTATAGHAQAQYEVARVFLEGAVVQKSLDMAEMWLVKASMNGCDQATEMLLSLTEHEAVSILPVDAAGYAQAVDLAGQEAEPAASSETSDRKAQARADRLRAGQRRKMLRTYFICGLLIVLAATVGVLKYLSMR